MRAVKDASFMRTTSYRKLCSQQPLPQEPISYSYSSPSLSHRHLL
ncbi:hypothetical protein TGAM01_v202181 [Trichoderma gamsii]|uniref:Uncharacterized protein n=1 Tax=Trichoderma gamsii TaxID=398673 RepID=A0A2P4ZXU3_9HYPO|nr:hypothetical protein TGAM01_v202181 [Trichoderma gamsii]PON29073.1 hypothetical protein TGAM01_v202181 [Trichoderma gamsii]